ncbi:MAG: hypothetical protein KAS12_00735, partial [Candidatus Aenigmarchaeota archaeon]|nr:hypothetical protein [Candidatus Aenigmarchaeota archaeon]
TEFFLSLGFFGFYTIWALLVGGIAVYGFVSKFTRKKIIRDIFVSWFTGVLIITSSPIGGLIFAVFLRMFLIGFKSVISIETLKSTFIKPDDKPIKFPKHRIINVAIFLIIFLGILTVIFAPPMEVDWYNMRDSNIIMSEFTTTSDVSQINWNDIKDMRIVAQQYALQVPKTMVTETGWRLSTDWDGIYAINNTLYWVMAYEPTRFANIGEPSPAYIIVNAQNPSDRIKIKENIEYSEERKGLVPFIYQMITGKIRDVNFKLWYEHPYFNYGDSVFTHDNDGNPVWFAPAKLNLPTIFITKLYTTQTGVIVLGNSGDVVFYTEAQIDAEDTPLWMLKDQVLIDEDYSKVRVDRWAKYANWKGFLNFHFKHENVFEIASDLYFQYDKPDERTYGLIQLEPEGATRKAIT